MWQTPEHDERAATFQHLALFSSGLMVTAYSISIRYLQSFTNFFTVCCMVVRAFDRKPARVKLDAGVSRWLLAAYSSGTVKNVVTIFSVISLSVWNYNGRYACVRLLICVVNTEAPFRRLEAFGNFERIVSSAAAATNATARPIVRLCNYFDIDGGCTGCIFHILRGLHHKIGGAMGVHSQVGRCTCTCAPP